MGDIDSLKYTRINCLIGQLSCHKNIEKCKDDMLICLENQISNRKDILKFCKILSEFNRKLSEFDDKLPEIDYKFLEREKDYIDNYIEAYIKKKKREKEYNIIKMCYLLFCFFFILCVVYPTVINF